MLRNHVGVGGGGTNLLLQHKLVISFVCETFSRLDLLLQDFDLSFLVDSLLSIGDVFFEEAQNGAGGDGKLRRSRHIGRLQLRVDCRLWDADG